MQTPSLGEALGCFGSHSVICLATCLENRPAVRPMTILRMEGGFYDAVELMRPGDMYTASIEMDGCSTP